MHIPLEQLVFVLYLDSLFVEARTREVAPLRDLPETLNRLHTQAMREHARESALLSRVNADWTQTPDWRLDRHVIRLALYLRERLGVEPGQRIALLSELRPEWLIADLAALGLGAVSAAIAPSMRQDGLVAALEDAAPSVTFVSAAAQAMLGRLDGRAPPQGQLIALDDAAAGDGVIPLRALLEMGGTLDTPERAQEYRAGARAVPPDRPAIRHYQPLLNGACDTIELSQGQIIERLRVGWLRESARPGDLAYFSDPSVSLAARLAVYAFLGDGYTTTALATGAGELSDLAALHPTKILAPAALLAAAVRAGDAHAQDQAARGSRWLRRAAQFAPLARARSRARRDRGAVRHALGNRVRCISSTDPLDSALAERLATIAVVEPTPTWTREQRGAV
jgi:long-chain acyl-CoA synthetase